MRKLLTEEQNLMKAETDKKLDIKLKLKFFDPKKPQQVNLFKNKIFFNNYEEIYD